MEKNEIQIIQLERETAIPVIKTQLILKLTSLFDNSSDRVEFVKFCKKVECIIRAWYHLQFEDLMHLYTLFDPATGAQKLKQENLSPEEIDILEQNFLTSLFKVLRKSHFKMVTDNEIAVAAGVYRLHLPIIVDDSKLDNELLSKYLEEHSDVERPRYADKYLVFRRGIGCDQMTDYFIMEKVDILVSRFWAFLLKMTRLEHLHYKRSTDQIKHFLKKSDVLYSEDQDYLTVERISLENMDLSIPNLLNKTELQEPTFERMIVVYRRASTGTEKERGIYVKQFQKVPMADMEIVLPEKKNPGLAPVDWVLFLVSAIVGLVALISSIKAHKTGTWVIFAVLFPVIGYFAKIYLSYQQRLAAYQTLITKVVYDKQLDSGRGTLLHLCDNVIQQEVKEVIVSFFMLMQKGKATRKDLDKRCEELISEKFGESCNFDVDDAVDKLQNLGIVSKDAAGQYSCVTLRHANEIIGTTTEELILAKQPFNDY